MNKRFAALLLGAMVLGIAVGAIIHATNDADGAKRLAGYISILTDIFLRLIKMIIAPLVFATLVSGIAHMEDAASIGRVGAKTLGWFISASVVSLTLGLLMVHLLQPGAGLNLSPVEVTTPAGATGTAGATVNAASLSLKDFITHVFPRSIVEAMANNEILQIVVFAVFVGAAVSSLDGKAPQVLALADQVTEIMLKITGYVMKLAPFAIFAALASTIATQGIGILATYAKFVGGFYLSMAILWGLLSLAAFLVIGRRAGNLLARTRDPALLAFSTASSEAAYPRILEQLQGFGVSRRIGSFVLPLGYSFNLDGSMLYCTFAVLFIAQAYGIDLTIGQQVVMLGLLMITSKGIAGVPRASLVVIAATLTYFNLPEAGLLLILAVDHLLDMGRSATNVVGNTVAAAVVAKWEGELSDGPAEPSGAAPLPLTDTDPPMIPPQAPEAAKAP